MICEPGTLGNDLPPPNSITTHAKWLVSPTYFSENPSFIRFFSKNASQLFDFFD